MFLTEDIDDAHGPTSPEQPSEPECNFFGIAGTLRASLLLWSLGGRRHLKEDPGVRAALGQPSLQEH